MTEWNNIDNLSKALQNYTKILKCNKCGKEFEEDEEKGISATTKYFNHFKTHCDDEQSD